MLVTIRRARCAYAQRGYSIMELLLVFAVIGILIAGLAATGLYLLNQAKDSKMKTSLQLVNAGINNFYSDTGHYPSTLQDLVRKPQGEDFAAWDGPYVPKGKMPQDSAGKSFSYKRTEGGKHEYELSGKSTKGNTLSVWDQN